MIKKFEIINANDESLVLDLFNPEASGFAVREVSGLGPVQATVNMADYASKPGGKFQGSRLGTREIMFDLVFLDSLVSIEEVRHQSYRYFPIGEKITINIETDERKVSTTGYVENNEPTIWDAEFEGTEIGIICESPYLRGKDMVVKNLTAAYSAFHFPFTSLENPELLFGYVKVGNDLKITNDGETDAGCIFTIIALEDFSNPLIYNDLDGTYFGLMINMDEGDKVVINTSIGEKSAYLIRGNESFNVINYLKTGSTWLQLKRGINQFSIAQADSYTKTISGDSVLINADGKKYNINEVRLVTSLTQSSPEKATALKPKEIKIPTGFNISGNKTLWYDDDTHKGRYEFYEISSDVTPVEGKKYYTKNGDIYTEADVSQGFTPGVDYYEYSDSKSEAFSISLNNLFNYLTNESGSTTGVNKAPASFGAGYLQFLYEKGADEDETSEEEEETGAVKLVMTHVKIPYYTTASNISTSWTFSNTYNKGVKYTYAKMKFTSCSFSSKTVPVAGIYTVTDTIVQDYQRGQLYVKQLNNIDGYTFNDADKVDVYLNDRPISISMDYNIIVIRQSGIQPYRVLNIPITQYFTLKTNDVIKVVITEAYPSTESRLVISSSKLKANSTIYSNRFVYHPEFNTAATTKELSYYFPDMKGQSKCVSYWDNNGRLVLVEFVKGNYTTSKAKYKKLKNGKKKLIKKKDKTAKGAKNSPGYKHWKYSTAKKWLKANPTYVIAELATPIEYYVDEKLGVSDPDDTSDLQRLLYGILEDYKYAIDDKITLTSNKYGSDTVKSTIQANYTKTVSSRYKYYNDSPAQSLSFTECTNDGLLYLRCSLPYNHTPYESITITVNGEDTIIDGISTDSKKFYGGYIDVTNGTLTYLYDSEGDIQTDPEDDDDILDGTEIEFDDGDNTIIVSDGVIDRLIYLANDTTILDRMNLKIEHDNLYVGI